MGEAFSLHRIDDLSMNSIVAGTTFAAMMAETVSAAASTSSKRARIVAFASGRGMSLRVIFVTTPRVPSLPTKSLVRSYPTTPFIVLTPDVEYLARGQHHFKAEHVVARHAVLERVRAARALGHVPADGRILIRRWVGGIEKPFLRDLLLQDEGDDARAPQR